MRPKTSDMDFLKMVKSNLSNQQLLLLIKVEIAITLEKAIQQKWDCNFLILSLYKINQILKGEEGY